MEQPPILGRPTWPGAKRDETPTGEPARALGDEPNPHASTESEPAPVSDASGHHEEPAAAPAEPTSALDHAAPAQPPILTRPNDTPPPPGQASWPPAPAAPGTDEQRRSVRSLVLVSSGVAISVLAVCNGMLLWLYQHSSLGVVITLGTFIAAGALAWLRTRSRQLTMIVLYAQALVAVSAVVGVLVALKAGVWTGVLAGGITLAGLTALSVIGLLYYTGERKRVTSAVALGTAVAVVASMAGAYAYLSWDYYESTYVAPHVDPPEVSVEYLIEVGQDYTGDPNGSYPEGADVAFEGTTCPAARKDIAARFAELNEDGQHLATPEDVKAIKRGQKGSTKTATVTASITVIDDYEQSVVKGPETWTFELEKEPSDEYWQVCHIERPA